MIASIGWNSTLIQIFFFLDGSCIKPGQAIKVEKAKFELKGSYNPKLKPKKLSKKEQERAKKRHEKMLAWEPDKLRGERTKRDKVIGKKKLTSGQLMGHFFVKLISRKKLRSSNGSQLKDFQFDRKLFFINHT